MSYLAFAEKKKIEELDLAPWASKADVIGWITALMEEMSKSELVRMYERTLNEGGE